MKKIELVNQVDDKTCASACISMLTGIPIDQVIKEFHDDYLGRNVGIGYYLRSKGASARDGLYMLCVPSLNIAGGLHSVVADFGDCFDIYDPQKGREGRKYYVYDAGLVDDPLAVGIKCYATYVEIVDF